ncbi:hypothetical protein DSL72_006093 [Monilinia vaccinii-corymbosi]|uniref:BZIP domain-containing protein n=1 Tax=Monilinia vaccinii-corymbosi TaxID=61207 RepID=A0A8A3PHI9_9HELO|nr:hypothetical protein DSL72_006093 [Monilinia vaccinii-corymbosi]
MTVTQIYPSIAPVAIIESNVLSQQQHFHPQPQIHFQHHQRHPQHQRGQQSQREQHQHQSYLDPTFAQHDLKIFTQGPAHNPSYDTPIAPYHASDSSEGSMEIWAGVMNWVDGQNSSMPIHQYLHTQPPASAPLYAQALSSPTQSISPREPNAKRDASTAASARFRQKKKEREKTLEMRVEEQKERIGVMESRIKELEGENGFLEELVMGRIKWKELEERDNEKNDNREERKEKGDVKTG